jgi:NADPH:quinone reductase-like Zn-dependent oxidoreductase
MKALQLVRHGKPGEALALCEVAAPDPEPGQVRVRLVGS